MSVEQLGRVLVVARVRPDFAERDACLTLGDSEITMERSQDQVLRFEFDYVMPPEENQMNVFRRAARPIVTAWLRGYSGAILCYGQTGSGKTYTMEGGEAAHEAGIVPRVVGEVRN